MAQLYTIILDTDPTHCTKHDEAYHIKNTDGDTVKVKYSWLQAHDYIHDVLGGEYEIPSVMYDETYPLGE